jgi:hypothetical protein
MRCRVQSWWWSSCFFVFLLSYAMEERGAPDQAGGLPEGKSPSHCSVSSGPPASLSQNKVYEKGRGKQVTFFGLNDLCCRA